MSSVIGALVLVSSSPSRALAQDHQTQAPNRYGLPAFYTLHVWAWKDNPNGTFTNWPSKVSCDGFSGQNP